MFKELRLVKLSVFIVLFAIACLGLNYNYLVISQLYFNKPSYYVGDSVTVFSSTKVKLPLKVNLNITDIDKNKVENVAINVKNQLYKKEETLAKGFNFTPSAKVEISKNFKSGVYLINNKYPFVVKSSTTKKIIVVYPYMNNLLYTSENLTNVFSAKLPQTSLNRTAKIDDYSKGILPFFKSLNYDFGYITDLDLEDSTSFFDSKLLIIYGKSTCWTLKMQQNFTTYLKNGGNVLFITSYVMNDAVSYHKNTNSIMLFNENKGEKAIQSWTTKYNISQEKHVGISYVNAGYADDKFYINANENYPVLKGLDRDTIEIDANLFASPPVKWYDDLPRINLDAIGFYRSEIIAYSKATYHERDNGIKGIFVLQPDSTSGKIVSLGTEDWCLAKNIGNNKQLQAITKNAINYLINKQ